MCWAGEPVDVADLRDEDCREYRSDTGYGLDRAEPAMPGQGDAQRSGDRADLEVNRVDQPQQRVDPQPIRGIQRGLGEELPAADTEQVRHGQVQALLGQDRVRRGLHRAAPGDQLRPVPDQLAQFPHRRRRDPRLG
jgi:hypothetical protein